MDDEQRRNDGMRVRREVLGTQHVDHSLENRNAFNEPFQDFITRYAWGEIWSRPGLSRPIRSLITLALLVALNREEEFKMHVHAAFRNGVTREQLQEVLLQSAVYCGLPAANNAFHWAGAVLAQIDSEELSEDLSR